MSENNEWITKGIKTSCKHKQDLYLNCQSSNNQLMKIHCRKFCKILTEVIKEAKRMHCNKQTLESNNKVKAVWKIVKKETGKYFTEEVTLSIKINDNAIQNLKLVANSFNTYVLTIIERKDNDTTTLTTEDAKMQQSTLLKQSLKSLQI
jgi:hypothetical protein